MLTELLWGRGSAEWGGREATAQLERRKSQMGKLTDKGKHNKSKKSFIHKYDIKSSNHEKENSVNAGNGNSI